MINYSEIRSRAVQGFRRISSLAMAPAGRPQWLHGRVKWRPVAVC